jgi:very-short-patch-repair endonuclease
MLNCKLTQQKLCGKEECKTCYNRSFASFDGKTNDNKLKVDCWDYEKNEINQNQILKKSGKKYWFNCDACNHLFDTRIADVTTKNRWCRYCCYNPILCNDDDCSGCYNKSFAVFNGKTDNGKLKVNCWSYDKNKNITPRNITKSSNKSFYFVCDKCDHSFEGIINDITKKKLQWCSYCCVPSRKLCTNDECEWCHIRSFASFDGKTNSGNLKVNYWDHDKNENIIPRNIRKGTHKKFYFKCDVCPHSFDSAINSLTSGTQSWCPYCCDNQKLCDDNCNFCYNNSFASFDGKTNKGKLKVDCWDNDKNKNKTPRNITKQTHAMFWFRCDECEHSFDSAMYNITSKTPQWCCYCSNHKICTDDDCVQCHDGSFASFNGTTNKQNLKISCWDYDTNEGTPRDFAINSNSKFTFNCDVCDHSFNSMISHITSNSLTWCPYCCTPCQKLCNDDNCEWCHNNSFSSFKGEINGTLKVDCWNYKKNKNITPRNIAKSCNKKFHFICNECNNSFESMINNVTSVINSTWCPTCKNKTEGIFLNWFIETYSDGLIEHQPKFDWCRNPDTNRYFPFDFVVEDLNLIIEIDGEQHFSQISNWDSPEKTFEYDKYKMKMAMENGYSIIRILQKNIWNDIDNWETKFNDVYKYYDEPEVICIGCEIKYKKHNEINEETRQQYNCRECNGSFYFENSLKTHDCYNYVKVIRKINYKKKGSGYYKV